MTVKVEGLEGAAEQVGYMMDLDDRDRIRIKNLKEKVLELEGIPDKSSRKFLLSLRGLHGRKFVEIARQAYQNWHNHIEEARYVVAFLAGILRRKLESSRQIDPALDLKTRKEKAEKFLIFMIAEPETVN